MIPMLMFLLTLVFLILRVMPGDPALLHFEKGVNPEVLAAFKARLGLDKPLWQQYVDYLIGVFHGDFGLSMQDFQPVTAQILSRFPATLELTIWAMLFAVILGVFLGIRSAKNYNTFEDNVIRIFGIVTYAIPVFFLGMILQLVFGIYLRWLPTGGQIDPRYQVEIDRVTGMMTVDALLSGNIRAFVDAALHLILPAVTLGTVLCGIFIRLTRTNMLETLRQDFVVAAQARGLADSTITYRYALKNAFLPILTMIGLQFAALLAGAVLTETTFNWDGLGTYLVDRISRRDYTAIQGTVVFFGLLVMLVTLLVDILYAYLDPRIRL